MKIAIIDLLFSWPPHGGADVDVYYISQGLQAAGHELRVFIPQESVGWERGKLSPESLSVPVEIVDFSDSGLTAAATVRRFRDAVDRFRPDLIFLTQGYFLKTPLIKALAGYPLFSRCYAHETACHKDILRFKDGMPCSASFSTDPETCRRCAISNLSTEIRSEIPNAWTREYLAAEAWAPRYYGEFIQAMKSLQGIIITTEHMREQVAALNDHILVIPHGVDTERFTPPQTKRPNERPLFFCPGRMVDPAKGFHILFEAASQLIGEGYDFEIHATLPEGYASPTWLKPVGDLDFDTMPDAYRQADLCVVPSIWEEPFGIVALEAMACGVPVCAARAGGLQDIVTDKTGYLFTRGDTEALAQQLRKALDNPSFRHQAGIAARERAVARYDWNFIIRHYYLPLLSEY